MDPTIDARLAREIAHFEKHYRPEEPQGVIPLSPDDRRRYRAPPAKTIYPQEFYYHLLGPLAERSVFEIAWGNGIDASLMATFAVQFTDFQRLGAYAR